MANITIHRSRVERRNSALGASRPVEREGSPAFAILAGECAISAAAQGEAA